MSRFYPGQKGHSPGYIADNFSTKRQTPKKWECKTWEKLPEYNIEMLYILTFQVLSSILLNFLFCHFFGQIPSYFWTWTDKIQISRFSRFQWEPRPPRGGGGGVGCGLVGNYVDSAERHFSTPGDSDMDLLILGNSDIELCCVTKVGMDPGDHGGFWHKQFSVSESAGFVHYLTPSAPPTSQWLVYHACQVSHIRWETPLSAANILIMLLLTIHINTDAVIC